MNNPCYSIDGTPVTAAELIARARTQYEWSGRSHMIFHTAAAITLLRAQGHKVEIGGADADQSG